MSQEENDRRIDYIEFTAEDLEKTKVFYSAAFVWTFEDYGPTYIAFSDGRMNGGFSKAPAPATTSPLVVLYSVDLEALQQRIVAQGGVIMKETYSFPGGRRFHFADPCGNVLAVWSDKDAS